MKEIVWSPEMAYAAGLMASDGCLSSNLRHLIFVSKDKEQVEHLKDCLGISASIRMHSSGRFTNAGSCYRIQWSDVTLYDFFLSIGLTPKKSLTLGALDIPDEYFFHFLRGSFDGDGSFYSYFDSRWKNSFMYYLEFISASQAHIDWIRENLKRFVGVTGHTTTSKKTSVIQLKYAKRETETILSKMYPNADVICLSRKRLKIETALRIVGKSLPESALKQ